VKRREQTLEEMIELGVPKIEAERALALVDLLRPCLKRVIGYEPARYSTSAGTKTALGLYRTIARLIFNKEDKSCQTQSES